MSCFPEAQDWLSFSLRPVNHPEESLTAAGDIPQCPAAFPFAGGCEVPLAVPQAWLAAAGRALRGVARDSATAELGSLGLGPEKFPRSLEEHPAAALPGAGMMAKLKPQERRRRRRRLGALLPPCARLQPRSPLFQSSRNHKSLSLPPSRMVLSS